MKTIGIITTCHTYYDYIDTWSTSIKNLNRTPDKVVIAASSPHNSSFSVAKKNIKAEVKIVQTSPQWVFANALNAAIEACDTDWICWIGIDDLYLPHALDNWENSNADIVNFGLQFPDQSYIRIPPAPTKKEVLTLKGNLMPCGSPFKRSVWEKNPFDPEFSPLEDWAFGVKAALDGATFDTTGRVDFIYRVHEQQQRPSDAPFIKKMKKYIREQK